MSAACHLSQSGYPPEVIPRISSHANNLTTDFMRMLTEMLRPKILIEAWEAIFRAEETTYHDGLVFHAALTPTSLNTFSKAGS